jgi:hypothetical protein
MKPAATAGSDGPGNVGPQVNWALFSRAAIADRCVVCDRLADDIRPRLPPALGQGIQGTFGLGSPSDSHYHAGVLQLSLTRDAGYYQPFFRVADLPPRKEGELRPHAPAEIVRLVGRGRETAPLRQAPKGVFTCACRALTQIIEIGAS